MIADVVVGVVVGQVSMVPYIVRRNIQSLILHHAWRARLWLEDGDRDIIRMVGLHRRSPSPMQSE